MRRYGSDKPDLRIALELVDVAELVASCEFKVFTDWASNPDGRVAALRLPGGAVLTRKQIDEAAAHAAKHGAKGLAWMKVEDLAKGREGVNSPIAKFLDDATLQSLLQATAAQAGDILFFGAGPWKIGVRLHGRAADQGREGRRTGGEHLGAAVGHRLPDVRIRRRGAALRGAAPPVHRAEGRRRRRPGRQCPHRGQPRLRHGAQRQRDRRRLGAHPSLGHAEHGVRPARHRPRTRRRPSSASCSRRCATARRRTAASPSASTASPR